MDGCTSKYLDDQSLSAYISADFALTSQWGKGCLVSYNLSKTQLVTFNHHREDLPFVQSLMRGRILNDAPFLKFLLVLKKLILDLKKKSYIRHSVDDTRQITGFSVLLPKVTDSCHDLCL